MVSPVVKKELDQRNALAYSPRHVTNFVQSRQAFFPVRVPAPEKPIRPNPRRPHEPKTLDAVRQLYETTTLRLARHRGPHGRIRRDGVAPGAGGRLGPARHGLFDRALLAGRPARLAPPRAR